MITSFGIRLETYFLTKISGTGALSCKMLLVRIVENKKNGDFLGQVRLSEG